MRYNDKIFFFFLILFFISFILAYFYPDDIGTLKILPKDKNKSECIPGQVMECKNFKNCSGKRICRDGVWSECIIEKICVPGKIYPCYIDSCTPGNKTCNSCGTGFSECK